MKKHLNSQAMENELKGGSVFFQPRAQSHPESQPSPLPSQANHPVNQPDRTNEATMAHTNERANVRTAIGTVELPVRKRRKIRHSFDIFEDQLLSLREIQLNREKTTGERQLMGGIVQQALDAFISQARGHD